MYTKAAAFFLAIGATVGAFLPASAFHASFDTRPADFTFFQRSETQPMASVFHKSVMPENGWYVSPAGSVLDDETLESRMCILSCSRRENGAATDNWMITPQVQVTEGMRLYWEAKSLHYAFRESYRVMVSETGKTTANFKELKRFDNVPYYWTANSIDLSDFAGKKIYIAFVHDKASGFLLGIDEVDVSEPRWPQLVARNVGPHFFSAQETPYVEFEIENHGYPVTITAFEARDGVEVIGRTQSGNRLELDLGLNEAARYRLYAVYEDGSEQFLFEDFANKSWFRRKMLVEKFTGAWCNNCPRVTYPFHRALDKYAPGEVTALEAHSPGSGGGDLDGYIDYMSGVNSVCADYPALWLNRKSHLSNTYTPLVTTSLFEAELLPTSAEISILGYERGDDGRLEVTASIVFAEDMDNAEDRIRPHFVLVEKDAVQRTSQKWQTPASNFAHAEYYFMPTALAPGMVVMHNVVRSSAGLLTGIAQSGLPEKIEAGKAYTVSGMLDVPEDKIQNLANLKVIADIVDSSTRTYEVLNADELDVDLAPEVIAEISLSANELTIAVDDCGELRYVLEPEMEGVAVEWSSSDESVAEVFDFPKPDLLGYVHDATVIGVYGKKAGTAVVTATTSQGKSASCLVTVAAANGLDEISSVGATEVYDLQGRRMSRSLEELPSGIYILQSGSSVRKIVK